MSARQQLALSGQPRARGDDRLQQQVRKAMADRMRVLGISSLGVREACGINAGQLRLFMQGKSRMTLGNLAKLEDWLDGQTPTVVDHTSNVLAQRADAISHRLIFGNGNLLRADLMALAHLFVGTKK